MALIPLRASHGGGAVTPFTELCGEVLLAYALRAAGECTEIETVAVVADEPAAAEQAKRLGARVISSEEASAVQTETLVLLGAMNPLVAAGTLTRALEKFQVTTPRPVVSVLSVGEEHPFRLKYMEENGRCVNVLVGSLYYDMKTSSVVHGKTGKPTCFRQNLPPVYAISSAVAVCRGEDADGLPAAVASGEAVPLEGPEMMAVGGRLSLLRAEMAMEAAGSL